MSAKTVDILIDERARLVSRNAAIEGHLFFAEILLRRADKVLSEAILPTPAMAAHRDVLREEIAELLSEDRPHPDPSLSENSGVPGRGEAPRDAGLGAEA